MAQLNEYKTGKRKTASPLICFCDIDGTLVHYPEEQDKWGTYTGRSVLPGCWLWVDKVTGRRHKHLKLPASTTGMQGVISLKTLTHLAAIRSAGVLLVLITGARTSTLFQRLPCLPAADAYVSENGGRLFFPRSTMPVAVPFTEDLDWRSQHDDIAGSEAQAGTLPEKRMGPLWDCFRDLQADGFVLDALSYTTCFRVRLDKSEGKDEKQLLQKLQQQPDGLAWNFNLGMMNVFPATSGKEAVAQYLFDHFNTAADTSFLLCDDANDIGLSKLVHRVFLPSIACKEMRDVATAEPNKYYIASKSGTLGTEEVLVMVDDFVGTFVLG